MRLLLLLFRLSLMAALCLPLFLTLLAICAAMFIPFMICHLASRGATDHWFMRTSVDIGEAAGSIVRTLGRLT